MMSDEQQQATGENGQQTPDGTGQQTEATFTQSELNAIIGQRLQEQERRFERRIAEQYGSPLDELAAAKQELEERKQSELSEAEKLRQALEAAQRKAEQAEEAAKQEQLRALRLEVGQESGLPAQLAARLSGDDRDTIKADAEAIKAALQEMGSGRQPPKLDATAGGNESASGLSAEERAIADRFGISYEQYAKNKRALEGNK